jgi:hypothetical protein
MYIIVFLRHLFSLFDGKNNVGFNIQMHEA